LSFRKSENSWQEIISQDSEAVGWYLRQWWDKLCFSR
jgi:hypothetical protein